MARSSPAVRLTQTQTHACVRACASSFLLAFVRFVRLVCFVCVVCSLARTACWLISPAQLVMCVLQYGPVGSTCCTLLSSCPPVLCLVPCIRSWLRPRQAGRDPPDSVSWPPPPQQRSTRRCRHAETCTFASKMSTHTRCRRLISDVRFMISEFRNSWPSADSPTWHQA